MNTVSSSPATAMGVSRVENKLVVSFDPLVTLQRGLGPTCRILDPLNTREGPGSLSIMTDDTFIQNPKKLKQCLSDDAQHLYFWIYFWAIQFAGNHLWSLLSILPEDHVLASGTFARNWLAERKILHVP